MLHVINYKLDFYKVWFKEEGIILWVHVLWDDHYGRGVVKTNKNPKGFMIDLKAPQS